MTAPGGPTAHVDTFVRDHLPADAHKPPIVWDAGLLPYPDRLNCAVELVDRWVQTGHGDRPCLVGWDPDTDGSSSWTYAETMGLVNRIANVLVGPLGQVPGCRVQLHGPNTPWLAACWLAVQKAGMIAVATMPLLREPDLRPVLKKAQVRLSLADVRTTDALGAFTVGARPLRVVTYGPGSDLESLIANQPDTFTACDTSADDPCLVAFTSGTTGDPKGCVHAHRDVLAIADTFSAHSLTPTADDVFIGSPPLAFTFGLGQSLIFPLRAGATAALVDKAPPPILAAAIATLGATVVATAPTGYRAMCALDPRPDLSTVRLGVSAGEALNLETRQRAETTLGFPLVDGLGATEILHVFVASAPTPVPAGALGLAVPGYELNCLDDDGNPSPAGVPGRLAVRGATGCQYLDDDRQADYVAYGWNLTGDTVVRDTDGVFWYQSRHDDTIVSAGYNIAGPEVEAALYSHPAVRECACVASPDPQRGSVVRAYIVLNEGFAGAPGLVTELQEHVKASIAPYKYPRLVTFRESLPRTATGKLQRYKLRSEAAAEANPSSGVTAT